MGSKHWAGLCLAVLTAGLASAQGALSAIDFEGTLTIRIDERPIAVYVYEDANVLRPYFRDLLTVSGAPVTRNYPPVEGQDPTDHATFHPGLWMAFGDIGGADFWRNKARVEHVRFVAPPAVEGGALRFTAENVYRDGERALCTETTTYTFTAKDSHWTLAIDAAFAPAGAAVIFGDQEEMGLGVRVATPIMVKNGGRILNSDGLENEAGVWGKTAAWADYSAVTYGERYGVTIVPDPGNFRPSWFHARDYGLLVANPFGRKAFTEGEASAVTVNPGESLRLRFRVIVYEGDAETTPHGPLK